MQWQVIAADARTGEERSILVDASTADEAEAKARRAGYLVSQVVASSMPVAPSSAFDASDALSQLAIAAAARPAALAYQRPATSGEPFAAPLPDYRGLRFASSAFMALAYVCYVIGLLATLVALFTLVQSLSGDLWGIGLVFASVQMLLSIWPLAAGVVFHAASSACAALRDIARNSFITTASHH